MYNFKIMYIQLSKQTLQMLNYCQILLPVHIVPSAPSSVQGLCTAVVWGQPSRTNGQLTGYDLRFYSTSYENIVWNAENVWIVKETDVPTNQFVSTYVQVSIC